MKTRANWAALLLCMSSATLAGDRYVADAMTVESLPTGETVTRLVSQNRQTVRQFWVDSVYGAQDTLIVFDGRGTTQTPANHARQPQKPAAHIGPYANTRSDDLAAAQKNKFINK